MVYAGLDIGALWTKAVVVSDGKVLGWGIAPTGDDNTRAAEVTLAKALEGRALSRDCGAVLATGAGKGDVRIATDRANEVLCAARGIRALHPHACGVVDIGAESTRVIRLDAKGDIVDYAINDKCASGTGVFLDAMAKVMGVRVEDMGALSLESTADIDIASTCVVFAESEVISQVHRRTPKKDIIKGIHKSIAARVFGMVERTGLEDDNAAIGGLALNIGIISCLEGMMGKKLTVPEHPQIISALGAALIASEGGGSL
jgi:predicted CoA-substrate-specific enzyme activase